MALANTTVKTLTKKENQKNQQQRKDSKQNQKLNQVKPKGKTSASDAAEHEEAPEQLSSYDSYYNQLSEEVESVERHVRELRQTPGLEHLTEEEAQEKVDFMLRFSAWAFNRYLQEQSAPNAATIEDGFYDSGHSSSKVAKVQKAKRASNKKVTESLSR